MTNESSLGQDSEECLETILDVGIIAENFREESYGLSKEESETLLSLEISIFRCLDSSWEIDNILEDGELSPFEFDQLSLNVNLIEENVNKLAKIHNENVETLNKIINVYNKIEGLITESYYAKDVNAFKNIQSLVREKVYSIDEISFHSAIQSLNGLLQKKKELDTNDETSKLEREIICLAKILGTMEQKVNFNVLYTKPTLILKAYKTSIEVIEAAIIPIYHLIKESYYFDKIQEAKEGLAKIAETEDFDISNTISIKGLFTRKKGISEIKELSDVLRNFKL